VASGVRQLDRLLDGLFIGDNVVWHDDAGSLASVFCLNFLQASQTQGRPLIYVTFDRSPRNLLDKLGNLAQNPTLTILDCFTYGKGAGSDVFLRFYEGTKDGWPCRVLRVDRPRDVDAVTESLYGVHAQFEGDVRFVFESLTGMQEVWGGEEQVLNFYSHSCPRLYELNTIAYWILEKRAHTPRLRASINQIAQVAIDLSVKRGTTSLTILKAEKRSLESLNQPFHYWSKDLNVSFETDGRVKGGVELGVRLKALRTRRGLSQTELANLVGVTPSTISQVESNLIYPSLPALLKMAEVLLVDISSFFRDRSDVRERVVFPASEAVEVKSHGLPEGSVNARLLTPVDADPRAEPYLIEIPPKRTLSSHFFVHKGEELGYLLSGELEVKVQGVSHGVRLGDVIYLASDMPSEWKNPGSETARLLWIKVR